MKIEAIIVDELPKSCNHCIYVRGSRPPVNAPPNWGTRRTCWQAGIYIEDSYNTVLPSRCPLQVKRTCGECEHFAPYQDSGFCEHPDLISSCCGSNCPPNGYCSEFERKEGEKQ